MSANARNVGNEGHNNVRGHGRATENLSIGGHSPVTRVITNKLRAIPLGFYTRFVGGRGEINRNNEFFELHFRADFNSDFTGDYIMTKMTAHTLILLIIAVLIVVPIYRFLA